MAFKKKSMNNYKTNSNREHCAIITAVLQDSLIMPLLLVRHLKAVPQTKIKKQKHSIPLHLEGTNVLPALCLLNYLFFFFSSEQEDNILETNTPQHLQKYLPLAKSLSPFPPVPLFCCIRKATGGDLLPFKPSRNVCKRETVSFQHPQNS